MDADIFNFCGKIIPYIDEYQNNFDYIIALLIRDIRTNDIIYINNLEIWYEYNYYIKKWQLFDFNKIIRQISTFDKFFNINLKTYIRKSNLNLNNKIHLLRIIKNIISYIKEKKYNEVKIYAECCKLFSIDNLI